MELDVVQGIKDIDEKTLVNYSGKEVIIRDGQNSGRIFRGTLDFDVKNPAVYYLMRGDIPRRFKVCDLEELFIPSEV